jgi:hypothetical protein
MVPGAPGRSEVNPEDIDWHQGIIANPNCSTIQMVALNRCTRRTPSSALW